MKGEPPASATGNRPGTRPARSPNRRFQIRKPMCGECVQQQPSYRWDRLPKFHMKGDGIKMWDLDRCAAWISTLRPCGCGFPRCSSVADAYPRAHGTLNPVSTSPALQAIASGMKSESNFDRKRVGKWYARNSTNHSGWIPVPWWSAQTIPVVNFRRRLRGV